jgi:hypothetical protein
MGYSSMKFLQLFLGIEHSAERIAFFSAPDFIPAMPYALCSLRFIVFIP